MTLAFIALAPFRAHAAPQVQTPGFYLTTIGNTVEEVRSKPWTSHGFSGLLKASAFAFADEVDMVFVAEKEGRVRVIVDGELQVRPVLDMSDQVAIDIDRGIGGIDVHPDFPAVREIILTYTHENGITDAEGPKYAKVARLAVREELAADGSIEYVADPPDDDDVILGKLSATAAFPSCNDRPLGADCGAVDHGSHSFTFIRYGPDGKIYVGTGDGAGFYSPDPLAFYALRDEHLSGKVLRINPDGTGPSDNPFFTGNPEDNASKVFAKGFRNPKSGAFDPATGQLCIGNVGWYLNEGIYCIDAGDNVGWPCRENGEVLNGYQTLSLRRDGVRLASCPLPAGEVIEPGYAYPHQPSIIGGEELFLGAVIGCATAASAEYPADFNGSCVFGDYVFDTLSSVRLGEGGGNPSTVTQIIEAGSPTDVDTDRDGNICYIAYEAGIVDGIPTSEIRCLRYDGSGEVQRYPVASFTTSQSPSSPLGIDFNARASYHTGGNSLEFRWDFGDGNVDTGVTAGHVYDQPGDYTVTLEARGSGETLVRSSSQVVRIADPDMVPPVLPAIEAIEFASDEHFVSSAVAFGVRIRNDRGEAPFRVLVNLHDRNGEEIAHLVESDPVQLGVGEVVTVPFVWAGTSGPGEYALSVEFYAVDWTAWTLKYPGVSMVLVRNRVGADIDQGGGADSSDGPDTVTAPPSGGDSPVPDEKEGGRSDGWLGTMGAGSATGLLLMLLFKRSLSRRTSPAATAAARGWRRVRR